MLSPEALEAWCNEIGVPPHARALIDRIRTSDPARRVGGGRSNVSGRYPSRKMGFTIQFESHRVELAGIYEMEHDAEVLEFYDQPIQIKLDYEATGGKHLGVLHTPDFFVIRRERWRFKTTRQMEQALRELPPPSLRTLQNRNGYHYTTLHKHFPDQCRAIQERFQEYRAASIQIAHANKIAEFRQIAYQLHELGTDLFVNRVLTRMSVPKSLAHNIARGLLAEIKREILADARPVGE